MSRPFGGSRRTRAGSSTGPGAAAGATTGCCSNPPAFGRGPAGDWRLDRDLADLLEAAAGLLHPAAAFVLVNTYSGDLEATDIERMLTWATGVDPEGQAQPGAALPELDAGDLELEAVDGRRLATGIYARWRRMSPPAGRP